MHTKAKLSTDTTFQKIQKTFHIFLYLENIHYIHMTPYKIFPEATIFTEISNFYVDIALIFLC